MKKEWEGRIRGTIRKRRVEAREGGDRRGWEKGSEEKRRGREEWQIEKGKEEEEKRGGKGKGERLCIIIET